MTDPEKPCQGPVDAREAEMRPGCRTDAPGRKIEAPSTTLSGSCERQKRLSDVPTRFHHLYKRAWDGKSRKSAIRAFCLECSGWSANEVCGCTAPACPLYEFREKG